MVFGVYKYLYLVKKKHKNKEWGDLILTQNSTKFNLVGWVWQWLTSSEETRLPFVSCAMEKPNEKPKSQAVSSENLRSANSYVKEVEWSLPREPPRDDGPSHWPPWFHPWERLWIEALTKPHLDSWPRETVQQQMCVICSCYIWG